MNRVDILLGHWRKLTRGSVSTKIFGAATVVAALTLVTQLGSIARELTVAAWFGTADCLDAFLIAFLLPLFVINVVAGSFNVAFMPTFIRVMHEQGLRAAQDLFSTIMIWSIGLLIIISLVLALLVPYYLPVLGSDFSAAKLQTTRYILLLLLPVVFFKGLSNVWAGVLNAEERLSFN